MEIRPLQGHFLFNVNRFYNVFRVIFLLSTMNLKLRRGGVNESLAHWHFGTLAHYPSLAHLKTVPLEPVF